MDDFDQDAVLRSLLAQYESLEEGKWASIEKDFNRRAPQAKSRQWLKTRAKKLLSAKAPPAASSAGGGGAAAEAPGRPAKSTYGFDQKFWDEQYKALAGQEWIAGYAQVAEAFEATVTDRAATVLVLGCGDAPFGADMFAAGYKNITNVDYSTVCIEQMARKHPEMTWKVADCTNMADIEDEVFDVVIEKCIIDTFVGAKAAPDEKEFNVTNTLAEAWRVLKPGGHFFSLNFILDAMEKGWMENILTSWSDQMTVAMGNRQPWAMRRVPVKASDRKLSQKIGESHSMFICKKPEDLSIKQLG